MGKTTSTNARWLETLPCYAWIRLLTVPLGAWVGCSASVAGDESGTTMAIPTKPTMTTTTTQGVGGSGAGGAASQGGRGATAQGMCEDFDGVALVASSLYLGDSNFDGVLSPDAWKQFGFNLDGLVSTKDSTDLCKPSAGAAESSVYPDGNGGIDNAWGKLIVPIAQAIQQNVSAPINEGIAGGMSPTIMLKLDGLSAAPNQYPVVSRFYNAAPTSFLPKFDGSDCWPVSYESLTDPMDANTAIALFSNAKVVDELWTSGPGDSVELQVGLFGSSLPLKLSHVRLSMKLDPDHQGATLGQLGGVIDTEAFIASLQKLVGQFDPAFCDGATFAALANQYRQASDILTDGAQDPNQTCNGISFGMGFKAKTVKFGQVAAKEPEPADPCP